MTSCQTCSGLSWYFFCRLFITIVNAVCWACICGIGCWPFAASPAISLFVCFNAIPAAFPENASHLSEMSPEINL